MSAAALDDQPMRNQQIIHMLNQWLADESGYDERVWPEIKKYIEEHQLSYDDRFRD